MLTEPFKSDIGSAKGDDSIISEHSTLNYKLVWKMAQHYLVQDIHATNFPLKQAEYSLLQDDKIK